ncbi:BofC C-terminal domain-containing protein [Cohnella silvisoli]|uniref:BofC C-terminal domain-containing protein n=1 Tax=Cohnella silvisoli TaxID=2873699 RepID=A0ABV1KNY9_9BACL|nr:BofC C-terminal domain-containing protein [Cohnella silvisoli]MCD9025685.1 BofC C-terminal domain-containing protein [Cohnella silvisoli]
MSRFRILKELKKSLKRKRRHVWSLGAGVAFFLLAALAGSWLAHRVIQQSQLQVFLPVDTAAVWADNPEKMKGPGKSAREKTLYSLMMRQGQVELVLHRTYLCGEETRQLGSHSAAEAADLLKSHREWEAQFDSAGRLTMEQSVDDLSPQCRKTAYIGMDKDGNLSLFDGPPRRDKVIRTFFQLNVEMLETKLSEERMTELARGIRVTDKDEYNSVLSTYNDYARLRS